VSAHRVVEGVVVQRMPLHAWRAWVKTLKTGDVVLVCHSHNGRSIFRASVRVTPTGKVFLDTNRTGQHSRTDWGMEQVTYSPGGGDRTIVPLPPELTNDEATS
jgi:hypothetical protein